MVFAITFRPYPFWKCVEWGTRLKVNFGLNIKIIFPKENLTKHIGTFAYVLGIIYFSHQMINF